MEKVFVYGTLKSGFSNNILLSQSTLLGPGVTENLYAMYEDGIPYVSKSSEQSQISGEVYMVDSQSLDNLDLLEGHPRWYKREKTKISYFNVDGELTTDDAWLYFNEHIPKRARLNSVGIYGHKKSSRLNALLF
tara:strand:- start:758 stop:1159 length:402 start_codon:yes stop_codon:yes gene_type:complete